MINQIKSRKENKNKSIFFISFYIIITLISFFKIIYAIPPIPTEFYGYVFWHDQNQTPMDIGNLIEIYAGNISCGSFIIQNKGFYGILSCLGDDNYTINKEGALFGQNIIFKINNESTITYGDTVWYGNYYGLQYQMVNLSPFPRCNNGHCELTETCITCQEDCGKCPVNQTGNYSMPNITMPPGTSSSGSSSSSSGSSGAATGTGIGSSDLNLTQAICQEDWFCSEWQPEVCPITEIQTRDCYDKNNCTTELLKPELNKTCLYLGNCFDFLKNQDETDVDCGGLICKPCSLGKKCIFDYDCKSGFCNPLENICQEPTCNDNFKNQGEEQIDCGGPCPPCEKPTLEKPSTIAIFLLKGCGDFPWLFVLLASILSLLIYIIGKSYIKKLKNTNEFKKLRKTEQLIKLYDLNRNLNVFVLLTILLEIAFSLYLFYFCEIAIWVFIMLLFILPLIIAVIIKNYVYDEKRKKKILLKTILKHEDFIERLIKLEFNEIKKEQEKIYLTLSEIDYKNLDKNLALCLKDIKFAIEELNNNKSEYPIESQDYLINTIEQINNFDFSDETKEENKLLGKIKRTLLLIQKTHKDILIQYKKLREEKDVEKELNSNIL
ncbi:MAG: hypothetical protein QW757_01770 [Candidatus Woesearchaeota archaeon]